MKPRVVELQLEHLLYLKPRLREMDRQAIFSAREGDLNDWVIDVWRTPGAKFTMLGTHGRPVAAGGLVLTNRTGTAWLVGTDELPDYGLSLVRFIRRTLTAAMQGLLRVQATCLASWSEANGFVAHFGLRHEGVRRKAGRNGEDLVMYAIVQGG